MFLKKVVVTAVCVLVSAYGSVAHAECNDKTLKSQISSRFVLKGTEVLDKKTQLVWQRCSVGTQWNGKQCTGTPALVTLVDAKQMAKKLGHGWHVPDMNELSSIVEEQCPSPYINHKVFTDIQELGEGAPYWSTTPIKAMPGLIYYIDFINGDIDGHTENFPLAVRLVRNSANK